MPQFTEICLEELTEASGDERFVRCVALTGGEPGLALDRLGRIRWMPDSDQDYGLWTSEDGRLALLRAQGAPSILVERGSRRLEAPLGQPVILVDQDVLQLEGMSFRVHVHGETDAIYAPERIPGSALGRIVRAAAAAATLALGGAALAAPAPAPSASQTIEVRQHPPRVAPRRAVYCTIDSQKVVRGKGLRLKATCSDSSGLYVGLYGALVEEATHRFVTNGAVTIKTLKGRKITVEAAKLSKPVKGAKLRFYVRR